MRIAIDIDLTVLRSDVAWMNWLKRMFEPSEDISPQEMQEITNAVYSYNTYDTIDYNLANYFGEPHNSNVSPMDFWRADGVYDYVEPIQLAVDVIREWIEEGKHEIVFVTHNKGNGARSKFNLISRLFGKDNFAYVVTKEKHYVDADIIIDDRMNHANQFLTSNKKAILYHTPYDQYMEDTYKNVYRSDVFQICKSWKDVKVAVDQMGG